MRDPIENVSLLQKQLNTLQLENQILKNILDRSGVSYMQELKHLREPEGTESFDLNQGARITHPKEITDKMVNIFLTYFWGRPDVYAKRSEKKNGDSGYYPQCNNFWTEICPRKHGQKIKCKDCSYRSDKQLTKKEIRAHLEGWSYNASDVVGVYPLFPNGTCRFLVFDFDNHEEDAEKHDYANINDAAYWMQLHEEIRQAGFYIKQQDDSCERFAVIDQEVVWYGGVNLLAKSDAEQSIMRVPSKKIAAELMELAFGTKDS